MNIAIAHIHTLRELIHLARREDEDHTDFLANLWKVYRQERERGKSLYRERYLETKIAKKYRK